MIKFLIMDVDGTLTDGKIYMGQKGELLKAFCIKDGLGIHELLPKINIEPIIITGRESKIVKLRCKEIGINHLYQNIKNKTEILKSIQKRHNCLLSQFAYIGDDLNDLECMQLIKDNGGIIACPSNAVHQVKTICNYICKESGGNGAVREFIEWLMNQ